MLNKVRPRTKVTRNRWRFMNRKTMTEDRMRMRRGERWMFRLIYAGGKRGSDINQIQGGKVVKEA